MPKISPSAMIRAVGSDLLAFPVTPFHADLSFDEARYRENLARMCEHSLAGMFAAGGTGEFFSLTPAEVERVVGAAVAEVHGRIPVLSGIGYGTALAEDMARAAERIGADGVLLLPPYLVACEQEGLAARIKAVCRATKLGVIVYNRGTSIINDETLAQLCESCPNLVGYKDGLGDVELMVRIHARLGDRLTYIGGLPTAETFALPYAEIGVTTYSSAVFNFVPEFSTAFYAAVRRRDRDAVARGLHEFVMPLLRIRNRKKGYAVSMIKAGMKVTGHDSGPVRSPLVELAPGEMAELKSLVEHLKTVDLSDKSTARRKMSA